SAMSDAQRAIDAIAREPFFAHAYLSSELTADRVWPNMDFDPEPLFASLCLPTLLFYGEDDEWQPTDASVAAWQRATARAGNDAVTVIRLPGTGHAPVTDGRESVDAIDPRYGRALITWLRRVTGLP